MKASISSWEWPQLILLWFLGRPRSTSLASGFRPADCEMKTSLVMPSTVVSDYGDLGYPHGQLSSFSAVCLDLQAPSTI